jgi:ubiquinol-cytochrome c reductase cytochrome c subunit
MPPELTRRHHALLAALACAAAGAACSAAPAAAAPQPPIVRPAGEGGQPPAALGAQLFAANCLRCHGVAGRGVRAASGPDRGPSLRGVGARAADLYLRTGYMPLRKASDQPERGRVLLGGHEIRALVAYIASLGGGPPIPAPRPQRGSLSEGLKLYTEHCAGCHQVVAQGGVVTSARVPPLDRATPVQIAEAVRTGPYVMPRFSPRQIDDRELDSIVRYVLQTRHPDNRGGWGIGNLGPFPEGLVSWLLAASLLVGVCVLIGRRAQR